MNHRIGREQPVVKVVTRDVVIKEIVSVELLRKLDQLIYREASDRAEGWGLFCGVMACGA